MGYNKTRWKFLFDHLLEIITGILLLFMVLAVSVSVVLRYIFNSGIFGSSAAVGYAYVWLIFLGSVIAMKKNAHIALDVVLKILPPKMMIAVKCSGDLLVMFFLLIMIVYGFKLVVQTAGVFYSPAMRFPMYLVYLIFPISGFLMFIEMIRSFWKHLHGEI